MVTIVVDQSLSNIAMYENSCLENIKKLYITTGKYDGKQQYKTIIEAEMVWTADGFTNNSPMLPSQYLTEIKPLRQFWKHYMSNISLLSIG